MYKGGIFISEKEYLKERLDNQIAWYDKKSAYNKMWFYMMRFIQLILTSAIPFLTSLVLTYPCILKAISFIREFNYNYYLPLDEDKCAWSESDRYCVLVKWDDFIVSPNTYIEKAFNKRNDDIVSKIKVYPD